MTYFFCKGLDNINFEVLQSTSGLLHFLSLFNQFKNVKLSSLQAAQKSAAKDLVWGPQFTCLLCLHNKRKWYTFTIFKSSLKSTTTAPYQVSSTQWDLERQDDSVGMYHPQLYNRLSKILSFKSKRKILNNCPITSGIRQLIVYGSIYSRVMNRKLLADWFGVADWIFLFFSSVLIKSETSAITEYLPRIRNVESWKGQDKGYK